MFCTFFLFHKCEKHYFVKTGSHFLMQSTAASLSPLKPLTLKPLTQTISSEVCIWNTVSGWGYKQQCWLYVCGRLDKYSQQAFLGEGDYWCCMRAGNIEIERPETSLCELLFSQPDRQEHSLLGISSLWLNTCNSISLSWTLCYY